MKIILCHLPLSSIKGYCKILIILHLIAIFSFFSCNQDKSTLIQHAIIEPNVIPTPHKILYKRGNYTLEKSTKILVNLSNKNEQLQAKYLINAVLIKTGIKLKISDLFTTDKIKNSIELIYGGNKLLKPEGFKLSISEQKVRIIANDINGLNYSMDLFVQMISKNKSQKWLAPQLTIEDFPVKSIRALYISQIDSGNIRSLQLLNKYRFNYLFTSSTQIKPALKNTIALVLTNEEIGFPSDWKNNINDNKGIEVFYKMDTSFNIPMVFQISNSTLLNPDSLAILNEAMWTPHKKRNYKKLIKLLKTNSLEDN